MAAAKTCYYPDNVAGDTLTPCYATTSDTHSPCCGTNSLCLSNGLCFNQDEYGNRIGTSGCTDTAWGSPCRTYCKNVKDRGMSLVLAQTGGADGATFCCGQYNLTSQLCSDTNIVDRQPFKLDRGYVYFPNTSTTLADYAAVSSNGSTIASNSAGEDTSCAETTIGVSTGVTLGVPLLIALVVVLWQWLALRKLKSSQKMQDDDGESPELKHDHADSDFTNSYPNHQSVKQDAYAGELAVDHTQVSEMSHELERQELDVQR